MEDASRSKAPIAKEPKLKIRHLVPLLLIVVISLILGLSGEILCPGKGLLPRSGATIVVIGVIFGLLKLDEIPIRETVDQKIIDNINKNIESLQNFSKEATKLDTESANQNQKSLSEMLARYAINQGLLIENNRFGLEFRKREILKFEGLVVIAGTFVWGYGDLILDFIRHTNFGCQ